MATSKHMRRTLQGASDETIVLPCSTCKTKNRTRDSSHYCQECDDYYCSTCVNVHDAPYMKGHKLLRRTTNVSRSLVSVPTDRCSLHPTELLDMICQNDDEIGCTVCMDVNHRSCIDVVHISEQSKSNLHQVTKQSTPYKVTNTISYNVQTSRDKYDCTIYGSCIMTSGNILLTDYENKKLKQLHCTTYKVIDQCRLPASPAAVCEIGPQEAAVALDNGTIQFVSMGSKMTLTRTIQMNHGYYGLAFSRGEMFVSDWDNHVYVYDTSGTLLRTISKHRSGGDKFSASRHIAISDDGNTVYVADNSKGVVTLDRQGRVLSRFQLSGANGVCTDGSGSVLVCVWGSQTVMQIGPSGNLLGVIADKSHGISRPWSVCYDRSHSRMIVTNSNDTITVLDLVPT